MSQPEPVGAFPVGAAERSRIGVRLRERREQLGISLRQIARRIGVSASLISQIERDKVNPSVSTLWALVTELGLRMGDVFWTGTGCVHAFYETQGGRVRWLETSAPVPPPRHSYRHERDWAYLTERLQADTSIGVA